MKAWTVQNADYSCSTVVFAETRGKARSIAAETECCEDMDFIEIPQSAIDAWNMREWKNDHQR